MGGGGSKRKSHMLLRETLCDHTDCIVCMAVSEDGSLIATGSDDKTVRLWMTGTETECLGILKGHTSYITCVTMYEAYVITGSADSTVRKWEATTCDCLAVYEGHETRITRVICNGDFIFSASNDGTAKVWPFDTPLDESSVSYLSSIKSLEGHSLPISSIIFIEGDGEEVEIDAGDERKGEVYRVSEDDILITGSADHTARSFSIATGKTIHIFRGHQGPISCMSANEEGTVLYTGSMDCNIRIWDIKQGQVLKVLKGHRGPVVCLTVVNRLLYSGSMDNTAKCWVDTLDVPGINYKGHLHTVSSVMFSHGYIFTGSGDACGRVFDAKSGALKCVYRAHTSAITCMAILNDNLYTGSSDNTLRVWDASKATINSEEVFDLMEDEEELKPQHNKKLDEQKLQAYNGEDVDMASTPDELKPPSPSASRLGVPSPCPSGRSRLSPSPVPSLGGRVSPSPPQLSARSFDKPKIPETIEDLDL